MTSEAEYTSVETAAIDIFRTFPFGKARDQALVPDENNQQITNARREASNRRGIARLRDLIDDFAAPDLETQEPLLLITLKSWKDEEEEIADGETRQGHGYRQEWLASENRVKNFEEIGKSISAWWKIDQKKVEKKGIKYAVAVYKGVTRAVFEIAEGPWDQKRDDKGNLRRAFRVKPVRRGDIDLGDGRDLYDEVVGEHGRRFDKRPGDQSPFNYWPREKKKQEPADPR